MKNNELISIIMPAHNAECYIGEAIQSVMEQSYTAWELLIVNDGSTDGTEKVIDQFNDPRIIKFTQPNAGVSAARNLGLSNMQGDYFCFLDADDFYPSESITSRILKFKECPEVQFVGGAQQQSNESFTKTICTQHPNYHGFPRKGLISLDSGCFINCGTWLIKRDLNRKYHFLNGWTHSEDLAFFLSISDQGKLTYTNDVVQIYRRHFSTMSNLSGLWNGYKKFYLFALQQGFLHDQNEKRILQKKIRSVMFKSFARELNLFGMFKSLVYHFDEK